MIDIIHVPGPKYPDAGPEATKPVTAYGCVRCQKEHRQGIDLLFQEHIPCQSKHGWYDRPAYPRDVLDRLMLSQGSRLVG